MTDRVTAGGKSLETKTWGEIGDGPVIVLLHEGLGSVSIWKDFPDGLHADTGLPVVAYSRAGYGQSDPADLPRPLDYMTDEAVVVLPQLLDNLGIRQAILVGHSDGGTIAAIHAGSTSATRVRGLVLIAPHFFTEAEGLASIEDARRAFDAGDLRERLSRHHKDPDNAFRGWNDAWLSEGFRDWNVADVIDYIRVPILAIQGEDDRYGTRAQIDEIETRAYAPVDIAMLPNCGHSPHAECPDTLRALIAEFTARLLRIEAAEVITA